MSGPGARWPHPSRLIPWAFDMPKELKKVCGPRPGAARPSLLRQWAQLPGPFLRTSHPHLRRGPYPCAGLLRRGPPGRRPRGQPPGSTARPACGLPLVALLGTRSAPQSSGPPFVRLRASVGRPCSLRASRCSCVATPGPPSPLFKFLFFVGAAASGPGACAGLAARFLRPSAPGPFCARPVPGLRCCPGQPVPLSLLLCCR